MSFRFIYPGLVVKQYDVFFKQGDKTMFKKIFSLFSVLFTISASFEPVYADQTLFGPKDFKIGRWHFHFLSHRFKGNDP